MIPTPELVDAAVVHAPLYSQFMSATIIGAHEHYGGVDEWVGWAANQLSAETQNEHQLLFRWIWIDALINAVAHDAATISFEAFIDKLAALDAVVLRDRLLDMMINSVHTTVGSDYWMLPDADSAELLHSHDAFASHFHTIARKKFELTNTQAFHNLLNRPAELQTRLVAHLRHLWQLVIRDEWQRVEPRIQQSVTAFQAIPLTGLTMLEAIERVTGRDLRPAFRLETLLTFRKVRFVPHVHNGPYIIWFGTEDTLYIGFPAREPAAFSPEASFDQTTFTNRCKALADETRLAILLALAQAGELSTSDIIGRFELDKSAASRHLRQLVATSLIEQERVDKAKKAYRINQAALAEIGEVIQWLANQ